MASAELGFTCGLPGRWRPVLGGCGRHEAVTFAVEHRSCLVCHLPHPWPGRVGVLETYRAHIRNQFRDHQPYCVHSGRHGIPQHRGTAVNNHAPTCPSHIGPVSTAPAGWSMTSPATVRAILFDTFGTVVDWRSSLIAELTAFGVARGIAVNWTALVDQWRGAYAPSMDRVRHGEQPWTKLDALHRSSLDRLVDEHGIVGLTEADRVHLTLGWHRLHAWPDVAEGMRRLHR